MTKALLLTVLSLVVCGVLVVADVMREVMM